jgi:hypothetical protein
MLCYPSCYLRNKLILIKYTSYLMRVSVDSYCVHVNEPADYN